MDAGNALGAAAQVAITLAGFSGVVVAFDQRAVHEWSPLDKFRLQLMLTTSGYPTALSLIGLLLINSGLEMRWVWRLASLLALLLLIVIRNIIVPSVRAFVGGRLGDSTGSKMTFYFSGALAILTALALVANAIWLTAFWPFFLAIVIGILLSLLQFVRLILAR